MRNKITRQEPDGPLRTGLREIGGSLDPQQGGEVFLRGVDLANGGLDAVLDLHNYHGLGDPDHSIPPPFKTVRIERERGLHQETTALSDTRAARL